MELLRNAAAAEELFIYAEIRLFLRG